MTVTAVDSDHDGLLDAYEAITPGLSSSNPAHAALDNDGDGITNLQEFVAGTNPNDSTSRLVAAGVTSGGNFQISFGTVIGKFYRVERSQNLVGTWDPIAIHVAGTGSVMRKPGPTIS